uniref:DUF1517 domain-containing protein n=1 Tax=Vaucheria litorea TaxID=109269 RepID=H6WBA9_VAULI|nr:hypothetical protein [Vaucheria litorea]
MMSQGEPKFQMKKAALSFFLSLAVLAGSSFDVQAATKSGGRAGGSQFSSPSSSQSYSPSQSTQYAPSYSTTTIMPVPVPVPSFSPFGYGMGFGYPMATAMFAPSLVDVAIVGVVIFAISQVLNSGSSLTQNRWGNFDDDYFSSLGNGVSVLKLQICLDCKDRTENGVLGQIRNIAQTSQNTGLSYMTSEACLALLRNSDNWISASSKFEYFDPRNSNKAESAFNAYSVAERSKFEKETTENFSQNEIGVPTKAVVSLVLAINGETLRPFDLDKSVNSVSALKNALSKISSDSLTDDGMNVLAAELIWTPEDAREVLDRESIIQDFPELMDL